MQPYVVFPQYNSVTIDPNRKEYETQVLFNDHRYLNLYN